jgi:adenylate cyclase
MVQGSRPSHRATSVDRVCRSDRRFQERQGVLAIVIEYTRFAHFLAQLEVGRTGTAFIFDRSGELIAAPDKDADELHPVRSQEALLPVCTEKLNPRVVMVKSGQDGVRTYET